MYWRKKLHVTSGAVLAGVALAILPHGVQAQAEMCQVKAFSGSHSWLSDSESISVIDRTGAGVVELDHEGADYSHISNYPYAAFGKMGPFDTGAAVIPDSLDEQSAASGILYLLKLGPDAVDVPVAGYFSANTQPVWSPGGNYLIAEMLTGILVGVDPFTGAREELYRIPDTSRGFGSPVWIDEARFAIQSSHDTIEIVGVENDGTRRTISAGGSVIQILSDGDGRSYFSRSVGGRFEILDLLSGEAVFSSSVYFWADGPSPNSEIAVSFLDGGISIVDALSGETRDLTTAAGDWAPKWSPDGKSIAFNRPSADPELPYLCVVELSD